MPKTVPGATPEPAPAARRWLLFVHQLPATPTNLRVRTWRRLQQIGAQPVKQGVYVLPDTPGAREDFEWLKTEVRSVGGDASVFAADSVDTWADAAIVDAFRQASQDAYQALAGELARELKRGAGGRAADGEGPVDRRVVDRFRERLAAVERTDHFGAAGRDRVVTLLAALVAPAHRGHGAAGTAGRAGAVDPAACTGRLWVTRPRPGVDRMSSAWLIRRFIDAGARFGFAADRDSLPEEGAIAFDMFGAKLSHHGGDCTFETLCTVFDIRDAAVARIAGIVHDLDMKDDRFRPQEATAISTLIEGLQICTPDDHELLERGITLFESLYCGFEHTERALSHATRGKAASGAPGGRRTATARAGRARRRR